MSAPTPVRSAMVDALVRLECGDGCGFPSCECYAMTRPSIDMAKKRVLAVLDNLPREAMARAACERLRLDPDEWLPVPGTGQGDYMTEHRWEQVALGWDAAISAARSDAER